MKPTTSEHVFLHCFMNECQNDPTNVMTHLCDKIIAVDIPCCEKHIIDAVTVKINIQVGSKHD